MNDIIFTDGSYEKAQLEHLQAKTRVVRSINSLLFLLVLEVIVVGAAVAIAAWRWAI